MTPYPRELFRASVQKEKQAWPKQIRSKAEEAGCLRSVSALRQRLETQRDEILNMYKQDLRAGQESADDGTEDIVDRANNAYNRELMFSLSDTERTTPAPDRERVAADGRGHVRTVRELRTNIAIARLEALPWARFCVDCQELAEKGLLEVEASVAISRRRWPIPSRHSSPG